MSEKKYESLGVDKEEQKTKPTLVEKAQQEQAKAREQKVTSITTPEQNAKALAHTTQDQQHYRNSQVNTVSSGPNGRLEEVLTGGHYSQKELEVSTTQPSVEKAKTDESKESK